MDDNNSELLDNLKEFHETCVGRKFVNMDRVAPKSTWNQVTDKNTLKVGSSKAKSKHVQL